MCRTISEDTAGDVGAGQFLGRASDSRKGVGMGERVDNSEVQRTVSDGGEYSEVLGGG